MSLKSFTANNLRELNGRWDKLKAKSCLARRLYDYKESMG